MLVASQFPKAPGKGALMDWPYGHLRGPCRWNLGPQVASRRLPQGIPCGRSSGQGRGSGCPLDPLKRTPHLSQSKH
jgi:hypothetical protein